MDGGGDGARGCYVACGAFCWAIPRWSHSNGVPIFGFPLPLPLLSPSCSLPLPSLSFRRPVLRPCLPSPFPYLFYALDGVPRMTLGVGIVEGVEAVVLEVTEVGYVVCVM